MKYYWNKLLQPRGIFVCFSQVGRTRGQEENTLLDAQFLFRWAIAHENVCGIRHQPLRAEGAECWVTHHGGTRWCPGQETSQNLPGNIGWNMVQLSYQVLWKNLG